MMKALTVQQPWAWAIFHGKTIENRTQLWKYRGPLAIHAGAQFSEHGIDSPLLRGLVDINRHKMPQGAIIGVVDLVDAHHATTSATGAPCCQPWGEPGFAASGRRITHLALENPRKLNVPIPCKGALGLWTPPEHIADELRRATT